MRRRAGTAGCHRISVCRAAEDHPPITHVRACGAFPKASLPPHESSNLSLSPAHESQADRLLLLASARCKEFVLVTATRKFGLLALVTLVALRVGVGWHFYKEGTGKLQGDAYSSAVVLGSARGPAADLIRSRVWDADGLERLNVEETRRLWNQYRRDVARRYDFDERQEEQAERAFRDRDRQLRQVLNEYRVEIDEYRRNLERRDRQSGDSSMRDVPGLRSQQEQLEYELTAARNEWLARIDAIWDGYERDVIAIASDEQKRGRTPRLERPGRRLFDTETADRVIPWFLAIVGGCLILGLLARWAALAGALFLVTVVASQWPGAYGTMPTYYQSIELLALLFLAAVGAGRFWGLDFFLSSLRLWCCPPKGSTES